MVLVYQAIGKNGTQLIGLILVIIKIRFLQTSVEIILKKVFYLFGIFTEPLWERAVHRLPILAKVATPHLLSSPDNFSPDGRWVIGEAPEVIIYFISGFT